MTALINPALSEDKQKIIRERLLSHTFDEPHFWIATSGSFAKDGVSKWVALSERALMASAAAVNCHLDASSKDIWLNPLPSFHVGGIGITMRAKLSNAKEFIFTFKWNPDHFVRLLEETKSTLSALVPTQIYDIIIKKHQAPPNLRAVIIGGGALECELYKAAKDLGWNVLPSYGLTEAASQVATAVLNGSPSLQVLDHVDAFTDSQGVICIKGPSLLTLYGVIDGANNDTQFFDPKENGVLKTSDRGEISGKMLSILGRVDDVVKILGENVDIAKLQKQIDVIKLFFKLEGDFCIIPISDERKGKTLCLVYTLASDEERDCLLSAFNQSVLGFERITRCEKRDVLPKTALGKIERKKLECSML